jgi:enterochelin esterase family protein
VHGFSDNDAAWSEHGKANWILDSLIAAGKARPMIVVMPDGHALAPENRRQDYGAANSAAFEHELIEDVIPMIEADYRVEADAAHRALAGLSMGGGHTIYTGLRHLDKFAALGMFSAGMGRDSNSDALLDAEKINGALKVFWIACGKADGLMARNRQLDETLTQKGIHHIWVESEGAHEWPVWRNDLVQFAPLLFTDAKVAEK